MIECAANDQRLSGEAFVGLAQPGRRAGPDGVPPREACPPGSVTSTETVPRLGRPLRSRASSPMSGQRPVAHGTT
jgi:hypothetical protein